MKIPKKLRKKIEKKIKLDKEIEKWIEQNLDAEECDIRSLKIVEKPTGKKQVNGEWCEQHQGICEDSWYGKYYWEMDNRKYLCMYFDI